MLKRLEILRGPLGNHGYANVIIQVGESGLGEHGLRMHYPPCNDTICDDLQSLLPPYPQVLSVAAPSFARTGTDRQ